MQIIALFIGENLGKIQMNDDNLELYKAVAEDQKIINAVSEKYRIYRSGEWPKKKKEFFKEEFGTRQKARNFCRKRSYEAGLTIVHPDGREEKWV